jgi:hypothetical protein
MIFPVMLPFVVGLAGKDNGRNIVTVDAILKHQLPPRTGRQQGVDI